MKEYIATTTQEQPELGLVLKVNRLDPTTQPEALDEGLRLHMQVIGIFSRVNPQSGAYETISPRRAARIPQITQRWLELIRPARPLLTADEIYEAWCQNTPANNGDRHPDELFNNAERNFGSDEPLDGIEASIMRDCIESRLVSQQRQSATHHRWAEQRFRGDFPEEAVDQVIDRIDEAS